MRSRRRRRVAGVIGALVGLLIGGGYLALYINTDRQYRATSQAVIGAEEKIMADMSAKADDQTINSDFTALDQQVRQWRLPPKIHSTDQAPQSYENIRSSLRDLDEYINALAMLRMFRKIPADDLTGPDANQMRVSLISAQDHISRAKKLLAEHH